MPDPDAQSPALRIRSLRFAYTPGAPPVVDIPELELAPGRQMLLTGGSGSGKSTVLQLVSGLLDPSSGEVWVGGTNIHGLSGARRDAFRGRHIGMIFQTFNLLHGFSAIENVMAALMFSDVPRSEHRDRSRSLLDDLGVERIDAPAETLSIGQQQRVAVARAVVVEPALVLADEPTASLDPDNAAQALDVIQSACRDREAALVCVSHDPSVESRFDDVRSLHELRAAQQEASA